MKKCQKKEQIDFCKKFAEEIQVMASSLVEDIVDSESLTEAWKQIDNFYRDVEAKRNFQKCTGSKSFSILDGDIEGHTKYLQDINLPIMVNSIWNESDCIPSRVAEMHIGQWKGENMLLITPELIALPESISTEKEIEAFRKGENMSKIDIMEQELQVAKSELKKRQDEFLWFAQHDMDTSTFERNAINDLLIMLELKEKIKLLEKYQSRKIV